WGGTVWTNYEEEAGRSLVEWRGFQSERGGPISFTVALYDPTVHYTRTGDGLIEIHYTEFPARNLIGRDYQEEDMTIGISSSDRRSILQVAFAGRYHPASANLTPGMAIRFTTGPYTRYGAIEGWVTDAATGMPLSSVRLMVDGTGLFSLTDRDGYFFLPQVPMGTHSVTAFRLFYNRTTQDAVEVRENETTSLEFALTHPLFSTDVDGIDMVVPPQGEDSLSFTIWNDGNGPLDYTLKVKSITEEPRRWDLLFDFNVSEICSANTWIQGVATDGNLFYLSAKNDIQNDFPHWVYVINREGELVRRFNQYTVDSSASRGYAAMDWIGDNLVAIEKNNILEITPEGELVRLISTPERPAQAVAYSWDRGTLFTKSITGRTFYELNFDGQIIASYRTPEVYRSYGLAWFPADPEGYFLYIFCNNPNALAEFGTVMQVWKMNPANGDLKLVKNIVLNEGDNAQDCAITRHWDPLRWIFIALVNRPGGDHLVGFDLGPNYSWISFRPNEGSLLPGFQQRFWVKFIAGDLPENTYRVYLTIQHNAEGEEFNIPVWFTVGWNNNPLPVASPVPENLQLTAFPNPFNSTLQIRYALPEESFVNADLVDIRGRVVASAFSGNVLPGYHQMTIHPHHLSSGVYWLRFSTKNRTIAQKVVLIR
ncbi:MAG: carboxypeptidase regulatory-like domain-containing protein, partial [bacterium]